MSSTRSATKIAVTVTIFMALMAIPSHASSNPVSRWLMGKAQTYSGALKIALKDHVKDAVKDKRRDPWDWRGKLVDLAMRKGDKYIHGPFTKGGGDEEATRVFLVDLLSPTDWLGLANIVLNPFATESHIVSAARDGAQAGPLLPNGTYRSMNQAPTLTSTVVTEPPVAAPTSLPVAIPIQQNTATHERSGATSVGTQSDSRGSTVVHTAPV